jgi:hypothetical protein
MVESLALSDIELFYAMRKTMEPDLVAQFRRQVSKSPKFSVA